jgi:hypothetical protein
LVFAALMACDGLALLYGSIFAAFFADFKPVVHWVLFAMALGGFALSAYVVITTTTSKAIYDSEAVEIRCAITLPSLSQLWISQTGRMLRSEIAAKRKVINFMPTYLLYPKDRNQKKLAIWIPKEDDYFRNWIAGIPDVERRFFWNRRKPDRKP